MSTFSIRAYLLLLVLALSVPLVMVVGYGIYSDRQQTIDHTKLSLKILVNTMVTNTGGKIDNARLLLERLAARPLVQQVDPGHCDPILQELYDLHPEYANVDYTNKDGLMVCSAVPEPGGKPINIAHTSWFRKVTGEQRFIVGEPHFGPITGKWVSVLTSPIFNARHELVGSVQLPLNLKSFDPDIPAHLLVPGSHYGFFNEDGILVWRNVDPDHVIGTHPKKDVARQIIKMKNGELESTAADGVKRFYSAMAIPDTGWIAWIGVPVSAIYEKANERAKIATAIVLAAVLILIFITLFIARRITRPISALENTARALHSGDLDARAKVEGPRDIAAVALEFNTMVDAQQHNLEQLRIAATAFESHEGMMISDANHIILRINAAFTRTTGYTSEEIVGRTPLVLRSDRHDADFYRAIWDSIKKTGAWQGELWGKRKNGEVYPKWLTITAVKNDEGAVTHYISTDFDITERKKAEVKINELAFKDQLTGLPNRTLLLDRLRQAMAVSTRSYCALMLIDLDNFKTLNDTQGHDMGDLLLKQVAERLSSCVRAEETVARLGGDEFVVILTHLDALENNAHNLTEKTGKKILDALSQPYQIDGVTCHSTPSIGITLFKGQLVGTDELLKQADLAMYKAKDTGRNAMRFFDQDMQTVVLTRSRLEADLRRAIKENQFELHYQPQVTIDGLVTGAEALLRWQHPERGRVPPSEFIPLAEESRLILQLGAWVLENACTQLTSWDRQPELCGLNLAVNVSVHQFRQDEFVEQVLSVIKKTGANPMRLKLELTESLMVQNIEDIIVKMHALKSHGVGFSLDDFGTGYSSLSYLKRMPLDQLKIDQSFVRDVLTDDNDAAIAKTIVALAQSLKLEVIAEGVENQAQRAFLIDAGCRAYQGYLFSQPLPIDAFEKLARSGPIRLPGC
jgi:diguanylate cyclase (GGDEF)-like protein/PAS domain S-box-containing protein